MTRTVSMAAIVLSAVGLLGCDVGIAGGGLEISLGRTADERFEWRGTVAPGSTVEIKGINGPVEAVPSTSGQVEVTAERQGRRSDPNDVRIEVVEHADGITICAVYPREGNECLPGDDGRISARRNDVKVTFQVAVPEAVGFTARVVNGSVTATELTGDVMVDGVNGAIDVAPTGGVRAKTINGSVKASMGRTTWDDDATIETVNGSVVVRLPVTGHVALSARTSNGSIDNDLDLDDVDASRRRLDGRLGDGGRRLRIRTVNGSVALRPAS